MFSQIAAKFFLFKFSSFPGHDVRTNQVAFAASSFDSNDCGVLDAMVLLESSFNFGGADLVCVNFYYILLAAAEKDLAVGYVTVIAGTEPSALCECLLRCLRIVDVAEHHVRTFDKDLATLSFGHLVAFLVHNSGLLS